MPDLQGLLHAFVARGDVPFAVGMVADRDAVRFSGAAGDAASRRKAAVDTSFRIFSMTRSVGATAAMILIDRGRLDAEAPVEASL